MSARERALSVSPLSEWLEKQHPSPNHTEPGNWRLCLGTRDRDDLIAGVKFLEAEIERLRNRLQRIADADPAVANIVAIQDTARMALDG